MNGKQFYDKVSKLDRQGMKKGLLHHIEIYVSDLHRSAEFWKWFLESFGYIEFQKWDSGISFKLDDTYLVFVQTEKKYLDQPFHRCRVGLNHLAFHADTREQVDKLSLELKSRGISLLYSDKHPGGESKSYAVFFEDPDRIKVEVVAP